MTSHSQNISKKILEEIKRQRELEEKEKKYLDIFDKIALYFLNFKQK
jgi:hypothetical protein